MLVARSFLFNILFYLNLVVWLLVITPTLLMPHIAIVRVAQAWGRFNLWLMRVVVGTRVEFRGTEKIPPGALLVAAKHQSFWDVFALIGLFDDPAFIMKRELSWIPFFGWFTLKARMIPIDRRGGGAALGLMNRAAQRAVAEGRQILIFPEGTRRPPGAAPDYKQGAAHLYRRLAVPCLPVALNSGLVWPRRRFMRRPGTIVVEFLDVLPAGLDRAAFASELERRIETASDRLLGEMSQRCSTSA